MRVVFDTNVIVAGLVAEGLCREILEVHVPDHVSILSDGLWRELVEKLASKFGLREADLPFLALYRRHAEWVEAEPLPEPVCRDVDDDLVLATAIAGRAELIVSGDADLTDLGGHAGIDILSPRDFLARIHRHDTL